MFAGEEPAMRTDKEVWELQHLHNGRDMLKDGQGLGVRMVVGVPARVVLHRQHGTRPDLPLPLDCDHWIVAGRPASGPQQSGPASGQ